MIIKVKEFHVFNPMRVSELRKNKLGGFDHIIVITDSGKGNNRKGFLFINNFTIVGNREQKMPQQDPPESKSTLEKIKLFYSHVLQRWSWVPVQFPPSCCLV